VTSKLNYFLPRESKGQVKNRAWRALATDSRLAGSDTVWIKRWVSHTCSAVMVVRYTNLTVWMVFVLTLATIGHLSFYM